MENQAKDRRVNPKVSVIVPVHNTERYLRQCLDSLVRQTLREIEIICIDDGSSDGSLAILMDYAALDSRVRVIEQEGAGAGAARNVGLDVALGEYVIFLDSDDFFELCMLEEAYVSGVSEGADVVLFSASAYDQASGRTYSMPWSLDTSLIPSASCRTEKLYDRIFQIAKPAPWTKLFLRSFVVETGARFQNLKNTNDLYFVYLCLALSTKISWVEKALVTYRRGVSGIQSSKGRYPREFYYALQALKQGLVERGVFDRVKSSYMEMARSNVEWNFKDISIKDLPTDERVEIREKLGLDDFESLEKAVIWEVPEKEPKISVIIPVYNTSEYLEDCINSVLGQSLSDIEVICVNDASTDDSMDILRRFSDCDDRVRVIENATNLGSYMARRIGMAEAVGEYYMFLDSDDWIDGTVCEEAYNAAKAEEADIVQYSCVTEYYTEVSEGHKRWRGKYLSPYCEVILGEDILNAAYVENKYATSLWGKLFSKELCRKACSSAPDISFSVGEDILFFFFLSFFAERYVGVRTDGAIHYCFGRGVSNFSKVNIKKFDAYAFMGTCPEELRRFLDKQHAFERCRDAYLSVSERLITDVLTMYKERVRDEDREAAAKTLIGYWHTSEVFEGGVESVLGVSAREFVESFSPVQEFVRAGTPASVRPSISVIIPAYNTGRYIRPCLDSVLRQTLKDLEIVCVNDGSFDDTLDILLEYAELDERITVVSKKNGGLSSARNAGAEIAQGEYLYYLDSDDILTPEALAYLYKTASSNDLDLLYFNALVRYEAADVEEAHKSNRYYYYEGYSSYAPCSGPALYVELRKQRAFRSSACLQIIKRSFSLEVGATFREGILHEDNLYTFETILQAKRAMKASDPLYIRTYRNDSIMTARPRANNVLGYLACMKGMVAFVEGRSFDRVVEREAFGLIESMQRQIAQLYAKLDSSECNLLDSLSPDERWWLNIALREGEARKHEEAAREKQKEVAKIRRSRSYRAGRAITFVPRKLRRAYRYCKRNGMRKTLRKARLSILGATR